MPSLSSGIHIALHAVLAHSQAIEVIEHNVANANTVGYRRQSAQLSAAVPSQIYGGDFGVGAGLRGSGVTVDAIRRFNLQFFDDRYRKTAADAQQADIEQSVLVQLEKTLAETSQTGLLPQLDAFWSGWQMLAAEPANTSLRANLIDEAGALANAFQTRAEQLMTLRGDQDQAVTNRVDEINSLASRVAELNGEISRVLSLNEQPNDLLDQRDLLLDRLAEAAGATSSLQKNGEMLVSIGGHVLVNGQDTFRLAWSPDGESGLANVAWEDGQAFRPPAGEMRGLLNVRDTILPAQQRALDELAVALRDAVNDAHRDGYGLDDTTGLDFFTGTNALSLGVNSAVTPVTLAAVSSSGEQANNDIAQKIADLKAGKLMGGGTQTLHQFYNTVVTQLGMKISESEASATHYGAVVKALGEQRESAAGVSLDEEAANLMKSQKAYQAAARIMTVFDELLDRIINGMGVSGR